VTDVSEPLVCRIDCTIGSVGPFLQRSIAARQTCARCSAVRDGFGSAPEKRMFRAGRHPPHAARTYVRAQKKSKASVQTAKNAENSRKICATSRSGRSRKVRITVIELARYWESQGKKQRIGRTATVSGWIFGSDPVVVGCFYEHPALQQRLRVNLVRLLNTAGEGIFPGGAVCRTGRTRLSAMVTL